MINNQPHSFDISFSQDKEEFENIEDVVSLDEIIRYPVKIERDEV